MSGLDRSIYLLLMGRQLVKVPFHGRSEGLNHIFKGISIGPTVEVKQEDRDFRIGKKHRVDVSLTQILGHRMVVGKIPVVDKGLVESNKWMCAGRVPNPTLGRVPLMSDPDVGLEVVKLVVLDHLFGISHDLQNKKISTMG